MTDHARDTSPPTFSVTWRSDLLASVVVFLVAMPLCMGVATASGAPVAAGLITGIIGGVVVGMLAGCPLQVSGPAAGLTVIVYEIIQELGFDSLGLVVLVAGALQFLVGLARLGQWFRAVSPAVIKGMLGGIGLLILAVPRDARRQAAGNWGQELAKHSGGGLAGREFSANRRRFRSPSPSRSATRIARTHPATGRASAASPQRED
jgi:hypothetical protein